MNKCALQQHLDRCRVTEHLATNPKSLHTSEDHLWRLFTSQEPGNGNAQEEKDWSAVVFRRRDLPGMRGDRRAEVNAKVAQSAPKVSPSVSKLGSVRPHWRWFNRQKRLPHTLCKFPLDA